MVETEEVCEPFSYEICIVKTWDDCKQATENLNGEKLLGLDCEWYCKGTKKISLVQIATWDKVYLFRINLMKSFTEEFRELLIDDTIIKLGVDIQCDKDKLQKDHGIDTKGVVDIRRLLKHSKSYKKIFLKKIMDYELEVEKHPTTEAKTLRASWNPKTGLGM